MWSVIVLHFPWLWQISHCALQICMSHLDPLMCLSDSCCQIYYYIINFFEPTYVMTSRCISLHVVKWWAWMGQGWVGPGRSTSQLVHFYQSFTHLFMHSHSHQTLWSWLEISPAVHAKPRLINHWSSPINCNKAKVSGFYGHNAHLNR